MCCLGVGEAADQSLSSRSDITTCTRIEYYLVCPSFQCPAHSTIFSYGFWYDRQQRYWSSCLLFLGVGVAAWQVLGQAEPARQE